MAQSQSLIRSLLTAMTLSILLGAATAALSNPSSLTAAAGCDYLACDPKYNTCFNTDIKYNCSGDPCASDPCEEIET